MRLDPRTLLLACGLLLAPWAGAAPQEPPTPDATTGGVLLLEIEGGIGPATRDYLKRGLERAADDNAAAVVLRIDTPVVSTPPPATSTRRSSRRRCR